MTATGEPGQQTSLPRQTSSPRQTSLPRRVLVVHCPAWSAAGAQPREFEQIVTVMQEFCPRVEVLTPGTCAIATRGPARYFGGEARLATKITEAVTRLGFGCRAGIADGLFAATLATAPELAPEIASAAAESAPRTCAAAPASASAPAVTIVAPGRTAEFLASHPVAVLGDPGLADLLPRLGIERLGEYAALPAAEVLNRFGTQGLIAHRLASGLDPRPLIPQPPSADFSVQSEFDPPVGQAEPVVFAAKSLAARVHARLAASGLACVRLQVQVICDDGQEIVRLWRHDGLLSELAVAERVRWQLDGWRSGTGRAPAGGNQVSASASQDRDDDVQAAGITVLRLIPDQLVPDHGRQLGLWGDAVVSDRVARAALRVQAMLGHGAVRRPVAAGGRSPAEQVLLVPFGDSLAPELPADRPWPGRIPAPAPATVFPEPRPASVTDSLGRSVTISGRAQVSARPTRVSVADDRALAVIAWGGPWPVAERWWDPPRARRTARFQLVTEDGNAWLAVVRNGRWMVEGSYD